jgi:tetratricopeptide (TPR) repeat protein
MFLCGPVWSETEGPLKLPKVEGSKNFDLEISQINKLAIKKYQQGLFEMAVIHFKKASNLARQLRAPSQGILYYNLSLSLHKSGNHEEATKQFHLARRFARGNSKILESVLLKMHECGFNPSVACKEQVPLSMNIEGSN